ncbi:Hsp20/alpha crystallin family protein [Oceaniovalibus sp. ACAM 378]|uniref:Hsp20/alpha crystallin family protein n=1 Tax=Oceaniovalibus sp. ACAM 378 TaxID=2599923 RepID=UPI002104B855|nr:Hsp20/alpha crystallin family protein [Oceaniovalibus sp. ACAM 378]
MRSNVSETDKEVCITAELPGLTKEDVDVSVVGNRITVKGEKKSESKEKNEDEGRQLAAGQIHGQVALLPVRHPALRLCRCCARVLRSPRSDGCP